MKKLILILFLTFNASAADIIDPNVNPTRLFSCTFPDRRTDKSPLPANQINGAIWYFGTESLYYPNIIGITLGCFITVDLTTTRDGDYFYTNKIQDIDGRIGKFAPEKKITVLRKAPAMPVTDILY